MKTILSMLGTVWLLLTATVFADETLVNDLGPAMGTVIPHDLTARDQNGVPQSFKTLAGNKGAVLVFFRSANWCPFCQMQLIDLNLHAAKEAKELGYPIIGVSYDPIKHLDKFSHKWSITYSLLSDEGSKIIDAFGVKNTTDFTPESRAWGVPHPIIIVTDKNGVIKEKLFKEGYRDRPEPQVILDVLKALQ